MRHLGANGRSPLHNAAYFAYEKNAESLIKNGADIYALDEANEMPLFTAIRSSMTLNKNNFMNKIEGKKFNMQFIY